MRWHYWLKNLKGGRNISLVFLVVCGLSVIAAFMPLIGRDDGGLSPAGMLLCLVAGSCLILAFVHTWRKAWKFLVLLAVSAAGFVGFAVLHNAFYALCQLSDRIVVLRCLFEVLHAGCFLIAIFVCPAGFLVGAGGGALMCFRIALLEAKGSRKAAFITAGICCIALIAGFFALVAARVIG
jgi:hypothetical protein